MNHQHIVDRINRRAEDNRIAELESASNAMFWCCVFLLSMLVMSDIFL